MASGRVSPVRLLANRFLLSKSSDGFLSLITWVSICGVALGVLALVVVTSVINGFEGELARVITGMNGDVILYTREEPLQDPAFYEQRIRAAAPEVQAVTASLVTEVMASGIGGVAGAVLEGFDPSTMTQVTAVSRRVATGRLPEADDEVAVGAALAQKLGVSDGSSLRVIIPYFVERSSGAEPGAPKAVELKVVGTVRMGMYEYDSQFLFVTLPAAQKILNQPGKVTAFKMRVAPGTDTGLVSRRLADYFGAPLRAKDWAQMNKNLFYAIKLEKAVISIILTVIVIVAAFNVVSTLMMMIHDKSKEIAILKAMGFRPGQGFRLFCLIGVGMGAVGTAFGVGFAVVVNWLLRETRLIHLPADVYYINFLPVVVRWHEVGMIAIVAVSISFLATLYPGWKVAKRSPLDGLRYDS